MGNAAIELKRLTLDSSATGSGTNYSLYQSGGNLYWYNGSGQAVQITNGALSKQLADQLMEWAELMLKCYMVQASTGLSLTQL